MDWSGLSKPLMRTLQELLGGDERGPGAKPSPDANDVFSRHRALGIAAAAGLEIGGRLYARPGIRATLDSLTRQVMGRDPEDTAHSIEATSQADWIRDFLLVARRRPRRLAVDGVPGSGKSTLARLLADRLGLRWKSLDHANMDVPLDFSTSRTIYEHHRLLRTQNVDPMDAILYIDEPVELSKAKVLRRRRGGYLVEVMDYDLLKRIGEAAFTFASGREYRVPNSHIRMKLREGDGFHILENVARHLTNHGVEAQGLSQEASLFLAATSRARAGFLAYVNARAVAPDLVAGLGAALAQAQRKQ